MNLQNCIDFNLPTTGFNDCDPAVNFSEIERIFVAGPKAAAFSNITQAAEWTTRLSQTDVASADAIRALTVIGDLPAAADVVRELSNGRKKRLSKDFTLNYTVDDISDATYAFFQFLDEQPIIRLFGFETQAGKMYVFGNGGILVNNSSNGVLARGREEVEVETGVITWRNVKRPSRIDSPIFDNGTTATPTTFDTPLSFAATTTPSAQGVGGTASVIDAEQKFEFNAISPRLGTPMSMSVKVATVEEATIDFTSDYLGEYFKYTDKAGAVHTGTFTNGTVSF
jgi:hypothetical protein